MNVDGHDIRTDSIDAVTVIDVRVDDAQEATDKIARGHFDILIRGQKITIVRSKRFVAGDNAVKTAAVQSVRDWLTQLRDPVARRII